MGTLNHKIYPSSAGFLWGTLVKTEYDSACLRSILIRSHGVRTPIAKTYSKVGEVHEGLHEQELRQDSRVEGYERELVIKSEVIDGVFYSGRCDFKVEYKGVGTVIHECKSTVGRGTRDSAIRRGKVKINHLAQLSSYLTQLRTTRGKLVYGYYELNELDVYEQVERRDYKVQVNDVGALYVDGQPSGYNVADQLAHQLAAAKVLKEQIIWDRPDNAFASWGSPCNFCPFRRTCDEYDAGKIETVEELVESAREDVKGYVVTEPKVNRIKR